VKAEDEEEIKGRHAESVLASKIHASHHFTHTYYKGMERILAMLPLLARRRLVRRKPACRLSCRKAAGPHYTSPRSAQLQFSVQYPQGRPSPDPEWQYAQGCHCSLSRSPGYPGLGPRECWIPCSTTPVSASTVHLYLMLYFSKAICPLLR
jgi:hypothetical protein